MKLFVVIPIYNEESRVEKIIKEVLKLSNNGIILIDDGSSDNSWTILKNNFKSNKRVCLLRHKINLGKGAAMRTGVDKALSLGADSVIFIDSDGQHRPKQINEFAKLLETNDLVFGFRELDKNMPMLRKIGNVLVGQIVSILFNVKRKDTLCGFWGFNKNIYNSIGWKSDRYGVETEVSTLVGKNNLSFAEIKIDTIYVNKYTGLQMFDAIKIMLNIPKWYFK